MERTVTRLDDGRELVYYDDRPVVPARPSVDRPPPDPPDGGSELRADPLLGEWVTVAAHRQDRTFLPPTDRCPLCPSSRDRVTEIPAPSYDVAVFENRFPSFARSRCEVVCFTDDHDTSFAQLPATRVRTVVDAWADRTSVLSERRDVEAVAVFENRGEEIGVTLHHPHGQIYGYPFIPPTLSRMLASARTHRRRSGGDLFAEVLEEEQRSDRVVVETPRWTAFVPFAARWPFEVHVYPRRKVPDLTALDDEERNELAAVLPDVLDTFDRLFDVSMPYVAMWYQAPVRTNRDLMWLHLRISSIRRAPDKLKFLAGSELAMGAFVNDVMPEHAAQMLRESRA